MPEGTSQDLLCTVDQLGKTQGIEMTHVSSKACLKHKETNQCTTYDMQNHMFYAHNKGYSAKCDPEKGTAKNSWMCRYTPKSCASFAQRIDGNASSVGHGDHETEAMACMAYLSSDKAKADEVSKQLETLLTKEDATQEELFTAYEFCTRYCVPSAGYQLLPQKYHMAGKMKYNQDKKAMEPAYEKCKPGDKTSPGHFCDEFMRKFCTGTLSACKVLREEMYANKPDDPPVLCGTNKILMQGNNNTCKQKNRQSCIVDESCEYDPTQKTCTYKCNYSAESTCNNTFGCQWDTESSACRYVQTVAMKGCACMIDNPVAKVESASSVMAFTNEFLSCSPAITGCGGQNNNYRPYNAWVKPCPGGCYAASSGDVIVHGADGAELNIKAKTIEQDCAFNTCAPEGAERLPAQNGMPAITYKAGDVKKAVQLLESKTTAPFARVGISGYADIAQADTNFNMYSLRFEQTPKGTTAFTGVDVRVNHRLKDDASFEPACFRGIESCTKEALTQATMSIDEWKDTTDICVASMQHRNHASLKIGGMRTLCFRNDGVNDKLTCRELQETIEKDTTVGLDASRLARVTDIENETYICVQPDDQYKQNILHTLNDTLAQRFAFFQTDRYPTKGDDNVLSCPQRLTKASLVQVKDTAELPSRLFFSPDIPDDVTTSAKGSTAIDTVSARLCAALCLAQSMAYTDNVHKFTRGSACAGFVRDANGTCTFFGFAESNPAPNACGYTPPNAAPRVAAPPPIADTPQVTLSSGSDGDGSDGDGNDGDDTAMNVYELVGIGVLLALVVVVLGAVLL